MPTEKRGKRLFSGRPVRVLEGSRGAASGSWVVGPGVFGVPVLEEHLRAIAPLKEYREDSGEFRKAEKIYGDRALGGGLPLSELAKAVPRLLHSWIFRPLELKNKKLSISVKDFGKAGPSLYSYIGAGFFSFLPFLCPEDENLENFIENSARKYGLSKSVKQLLLQSSALDADVRCYAELQGKLKKTSKKETGEVTPNELEALGKKIAAYPGAVVLFNSAVARVKLENLKHLQKTETPLDTARKRVLARIIWNIYSPLLKAGNFYPEAAEMEDAALEVSRPDDFSGITEKVSALREDLDLKKSKCTTALRKALKIIGVSASVDFRDKRPYSMWQKSRAKKIPPENLFDVLAGRVTVGNFYVPSAKTDCYRVHAMLRVMAGETPGEWIPKFLPEKHAKAELPKELTALSREYSEKELSFSAAAKILKLLSEKYSEAELPEKKAELYRNLVFDSFYNSLKPDQKLDLVKLGRDLKLQEVEVQPGRDYIRHPKNTYRALHILLHFNPGLFERFKRLFSRAELPAFEMQILSREMHHNNQYGSASHLTYKGAPSSFVKKLNKDIRGSMGILPDPEKTVPVKFATPDGLKQFEFSSKAKILDLLALLHPLDFGFKEIVPAIGEHSTGKYKKVHFKALEKKVPPRIDFFKPLDQNRKNTLHLVSEVLDKEVSVEQLRSWLAESRQLLPHTTKLIEERLQEKMDEERERAIFSENQKAFRAMLWRGGKGKE